jgi:hypothetical protein
MFLAFLLLSLEGNSSATTLGLFMPPRGFPGFTDCRGADMLFMTLHPVYMLALTLVAQLYLVAHCIQAVRRSHLSPPLQQGARCALWTVLTFRTVANGVLTTHPEMLLPLSFGVNLANPMAALNAGSIVTAGCLAGHRLVRHAWPKPSPPARPC